MKVQQSKQYGTGIKDIQSPEINPSIYSQMIFDRGDEVTQ